MKSWMNTDSQTGDRVIWIQFGSETQMDTPYSIPDCKVACATKGKKIIAINIHIPREVPAYPFLTKANPILEYLDNMDEVEKE
jgi:hypothetical protein